MNSYKKNQWVKSNLNKLKTEHPYGKGFLIVKIQDETLFKMKITMKRWTKVVCLKNHCIRNAKKILLLKCEHPQILNCQCMNPGSLLSPKRGSKYKHRNIKGIPLKIFLKNYLASVSYITVQKSWDFVDFKWISYDPRLFRGPILVQGST